MYVKSSADSEHTTNLIIINDVMERVSNEVYPKEIELFLQNFGGAMAQELCSALFDQHLVLCPKTLLVSYQNIVELWEFFANGSQQDIINKYVRESYDDEPTTAQKSTINSINAS